MKHPFKLDDFMIQAFYNFREPFWECPPNLWFCYPYTNQQCFTGRSSCREKGTWYGTKTNSISRSCICQNEDIVCYQVANPDHGIDILSRHSSNSHSYVRILKQFEMKGSHCLSFSFS